VLNDENIRLSFILLWLIMILPISVTSNANSSQYLCCYRLHCRMECNKVENNYPWSVNLFAGRSGKFFSSHLKCRDISWCSYFWWSTCCRFVLLCATAILKAIDPTVNSFPIGNVIVRLKLHQRFLKLSNSPNLGLVSKTSL